MYRYSFILNILYNVYKTMKSFVSLQLFSRTAQIFYEENTV